MESALLQVLKVWGRGGGGARGVVARASGSAAAPPSVVLGLAAGENLGRQLLVSHRGAVLALGRDGSALLPDPSGVFLLSSDTQESPSGNSR